MRESAIVHQESTRFEGEEVPLTIRHFFLGDDIALGRMWEFHDGLNARSDVRYYLHILSPYPSSPEDIEDRPYVIRRRSLLRLLWTPLDRAEVWIIRGWDHPFIVLAAILARCRRVPTLMWMERPGQTYEAATFEQAIRIWLRQRLLPILFIPYRRSTLFLGTGWKAVRAFQELSHGGPARVFPYPNPIADACLKRNARFREPDTLPLFLFVGSFTHRKAVDLIASACEDLWRSGYEFRVRYVGNGPLRGAVEEHVGRSGGRAKVYPYADKARLLRHYKDADAVLLPSRFDGWGLPVHEGLASGLPVIVSDACGAADLVAETGCGKVVRANNVEALKEAVTYLMELTIQERKRIHRKALAIAQDLTVPKLTNALLTYCYEALRFKN